MTLSTGVGSHPGDDATDYAEAVRIALGETGLPYVPELPARGAGATMTGRGLAIVSGLGVDLQPAGWRLTDASGIDHRRAVSLLNQDLDAVEEQLQAYAGPVKAQVAGPWTLAATVEKPRGDKVVSDSGARRDLAQALAEGVGAHVRDLRRRVSTERLIVQVDEPLLDAVVNARVPTASGFGRHRKVDLPEASAALEWVFSAITDAGGEPWVHSCGPTPWGLVVGAGAQGLSVDLSMVSADDLDTCAEALEGGATLALGVVPSTDPSGAAPTDTHLTERVLRWLDMLGLDPDVVVGQLVITPTCGLAGASQDWVRGALSLGRSVAGNL